LEENNINIYYALTREESLLQ